MRYLIFCMFMLLLGQDALAAELFGTVDALSGTASVSDPAGKTDNVVQGMQIYAGQTIDSGEDGEVHLVTEDGGIIAVRPHTLFRVDEYHAQGESADRIFMSLLKGTIRSITGWIGKYNNAAYRITTPTATIGIRGTDHETSVIDKADGDEAGTYDNVYEGKTVLQTPQGTAEVTPGKYAFAARGKAAAPVFLAHAPHFLENRRLKLEQRIEQRKAELRPRLEQMRNERIRSVGEHGRGNANAPTAHRSGFFARHRERLQQYERLRHPARLLRGEHGNAAKRREAAHEAERKH